MQIFKFDVPKCTDLLKTYLKFILFKIHLKFIYFEKKQFKMLDVFSSFFGTDTNVMFGYEF